MRCEKRLENLSHLINDLLDLGRKRMDLSKKMLHPINLKDMLELVVNLYRSEAEEKNLELRCDIQDSLAPVLAEERMIDELFNNLISNAIKYTLDGGAVHVRLVQESPAMICFEVSDTGIGISAEDMPRLFSEFFRSEHARELTEEGTGLGLVIVKEIMDRLRGTLDVQSELGKGSQFTCFFPLTDGLS